MLTCGDLATEDRINRNTCAIGPTATGTETETLTLSCIPVTAGPATTETPTWNDATGDTSTWSAPTVVGQTVVFTARSLPDVTPATPPPRSPPVSATSAPSSPAC